MPRGDLVRRPGEREREDGDERARQRRREQPYPCARSRREEDRRRRGQGEGWVGLRGAVPIVLAVFPFLAGVADAAAIFEIAFVVAIASLLLQGTTVARMARALRVTLPPLAQPLARVRLDPLGPAPASFVQFRVESAGPLLGVDARSVDWPAGSRVVNVVRAEASLTPTEAGPLAPGDLVGFIAAPSAEAELAQWFREDAATFWHAAFGDFEFAGDVRHAEIVALYGAAGQHGALDERSQQTGDLAVEVREVARPEHALLADALLHVRDHGLLGLAAHHALLAEDLARPAGRRLSAVPLSRAWPQISG